MLQQFEVMEFRPQTVWNINNVTVPRDRLFQGGVFCLHLFHGTGSGQPADSNDDKPLQRGEEECRVHVEVQRSSVWTSHPESAGRDAGSLPRMGVPSTML